MRRDLMLAMAELRETKEKAMARVDRLVFVEDDIERLVDCGAVDWYDEEWNPSLSDNIRERLRIAVNVVYGAMGRDTVDFTVDGERAFVVTGGPSWGDEPSNEYADFNLFNCFVGFPYWLDPNDPKRKAWESA